VPAVLSDPSGATQASWSQNSGTDGPVKCDARTLPDGATLGADLCIVGAGPAGITLAHELVGSRLDVLLLESGGLAPDEPPQALNDGTVTGDAYADLRSTRYRRAGGTAHIWNTQVDSTMGAKYVPLDPWDFEPRPDVPLSGWPFSYCELEPFYVRAQHVCGLGRFSYDGADWTCERRRRLPLGGALSTRVYQFGRADLFTRTYVEDICASPNISLCHDITVCELEIRGRTTRVDAVTGASLTGRRFRIHARRFVLAAGAIENARLLLLSATRGGREHGDRGGCLGTCLMEHPRDRSLTLVPRSPRFSSEATFYDMHPAPDGTVVCGRVAIDASAIRAHGLPNASVTLLPAQEDARWPAGRRILHRLRSWIGLPQYRRGYGWSQRSWIRFPSRFQLLINLEQYPQPENRILLSSSRDALGMPQVEMHWRLDDRQRAGLARLRELVLAEVEAAGLGHVVVDPHSPLDPNAHHHAGTTRMHRDAREGIVDAHLRVHGMENLYVVGSSVFPTAGYANPTLTIVALSLRLADHLRRHA
jgi:choline dehydrogenase-like flavoprotein